MVLQQHTTYTSHLHADKQARVLLACDTRPSSPALLAAAVAGVETLGGTAVQCGQLTTPMLHWQLRRLNQGLPWALQDYFTTLAGAFEQVVAGSQSLGQASCLSHLDSQLAHCSGLACAAQLMVVFLCHCRACAYKLHLHITC